MADKFKRAARRVIQGKGDDESGFQTGVVLEAALQSQHTESPVFELALPVLERGAQTLQRRSIGPKHVQTFYLTIDGHVSKVSKAGEEGDGRDGSTLSTPPQLRQAEGCPAEDPAESMSSIMSCIAKWLRSSRQNSKHVNASQAVLDTYHDSFLFGQLPLTVKVRAALRAGWLGAFLNLLEFAAALAGIIIYIKSTYMTHVPHGLYLAYGVLGIFFLVDYLLKVYSSNVRLHYIASRSGGIDLLSCIPFILFLFHVGRNGAIFRFILFIRILRPFSHLKSMGILKSAIAQQILDLVISLVSIIIFFASLLQWVELAASSPALLKSNGCHATGCMTFFEAIYFVVVTISTVGYGDITPNTDWGRLIVIFIIIATLVVVPVQIGEIVDTATLSPYGGRYSARKVVGSRYVILCGCISFKIVQNFLSQFYHPLHDEDLRMYPLYVVIMAPCRPSFKLKSLLALYHGLVEFIEGSPINMADLDRVSAKAATAIFVLAKPTSTDREVEDAAQVVRALSLHQYCGPQARVIVELSDPDVIHSAIWDDTQSATQPFCPDQVRFRLLASSCFLRGLSTLLANLFRTTLSVENPQLDSWQQDYYSGHINEMYPVLLPPALSNRRFEEVAEFVFRRFRAVLFALDILVDFDQATSASRRQVFLFPKGHIISPTDVAIVIASSLHAAEDISRVGRPPSIWTKLRSCGCRPGFRCPCFPTYGKGNPGGESPQEVPSQGGYQSDFNLLAEIRASWTADTPGAPGQQDVTGSVVENPNARSSGPYLHAHNGADISSHVSSSKRLSREPRSLELQMCKAVREGSWKFSSDTRIGASGEPVRSIREQGHSASGVEEFGAELEADFSSLDRSAGENRGTRPQDVARASPDVQDEAVGEGGGSKDWCSPPNQEPESGNVESTNMRQPAPSRESPRDSSKVRNMPQPLPDGNRGPSEPGEGVAQERVKDPGGGMGSEKRRGLGAGRAWQELNPKVQKMSSLEEAVERLLQWPPATREQKPHPAILGRRQEEILQHLEEHTLRAVAFSQPHTLLCIQGQWPQNLFQFVAQVRLPRYPQRPLVLLHPSLPLADEWGTVGFFDDVYFVRGSPLYELDLIRAGVLQAAKVVVVVEDGGEEDEVAVATEDKSALILSRYVPDVNNVEIAANVERMTGSDDCLLVEVQHEQSMQYLRPKFSLPEQQLARKSYLRNKEGIFQFSPPYISGKAWCPSIIAFITLSIFYNHNTEKIVDLFLNGGPAEGPEMGDGNIRQIDQINVPQEFEGKTYEELWLGLLHTRGFLALGLYRARGTKGAPTPYVHTNPAPATIVWLSDAVYVAR